MYYIYIYIYIICVCVCVCACVCVSIHFDSTANKYSSASHHEQKNKKATGQIKFFGGHNKTANKTSLTAFSM